MTGQNEQVDTFAQQMARHTTGPNGERLRRACVDCRWIRPYLMCVQPDVVDAHFDKVLGCRPVPCGVERQSRFNQCGPDADCFEPPRVKPTPPTVLDRLRYWWWKLTVRPKAVESPQTDADSSTGKGQA